MLIQSDEKAFSLFEKSAKQGLAAGQFNLAEMYKDGRGSVRNLSEAVRLYKLAADQGLQQAVIAYASMLYKGEGISQDKSQAANLFKKSGVPDHILQSLGVTN